MSLTLLGLGTALPHPISQPRSAKVARILCCRTDEQGEMLLKLYDHSSINTRYSVVGDDVMTDVLNGTCVTQSIFLPGRGEDDLGPTTSQRMAYYAEHAPPLALQSARQALQHAGLAPQALTHLVTVSCTGFVAPGVDVALIKGLHLAPTIQRTNIGFMGCHGAVNGLRVAQALAESQPQARVLLCACELCSIHFHYQWDPKRNVANALFADGAAAIVADASEATPTRDDWRLVDTASCLFPDTEFAMGWSIGNHGFDMTLSTRIPALIAGSLRPWLEGWLERHGLSIGTVGSWAVHPGGPKVLDAVADCLVLPADALADSRDVLTECGNMSSPTVLFILDRLRRRGAPRPCVVLGFGPGLIAEAALII